MNDSPGGRTVSVILEPALGATVLQWILYFCPSIASVLENPTRPSLAERSECDCYSKENVYKTAKHNKEEM